MDFTLVFERPDIYIALLLNCLFGVYQYIQKYLVELTRVTGYKWKFAIFFMYSDSMFQFMMYQSQRIFEPLVYI